MRADEYSAIHRWFDVYLDGFRKKGALHPLHELKRSHSLRVADNAALLAAGLELAPGEILLARAAGLVHDAGRFAQFRDHGSLRDDDTVDHGAEGRNTLEALAAGFFSDACERDRLFTAVQYHNRRTADIPALEPESAKLLKLLRDADKLDIIEVVLASMAADGFRDLPVMLPHMEAGREFTPGLLAKAAGGSGLNTSELRTAADMLLMSASWFYDLNYPASHRLAVRRGLLSRLRRELPATDETADFFRNLENISQAAAAGDTGGEMDAKAILKAVWELREGPAVFTTVDKNGLPNSVYVLGMKLLEDGSIAVIDNYFHKTRENIKNGSKGSFLFLAKPRKAYQAKGRIEYFTSGPEYEKTRAVVDTKYPRVAAAVLRVEELYSGDEKLF
ncbi:MAG TPA: hypothetical protein DCL44_00855 [Elusimicrobia bacterium]|nr:hypothetical protein [Elusimicrobiota bacterium]